MPGKYWSVFISYPLEGKVHFLGSFVQVYFLGRFVSV